MSAGQRLIRFGAGSLIGVGLGSIAAALLAPTSGEGLRHRLRVHLAIVKVAGLEAEAAKTSELAQKFRDRVNDPAALNAAVIDAQQKAAEAAATLQAAVAGAPGAESSNPPANSSHA